MRKLTIRRTQHAPLDKLLLMGYRYIETGDDILYRVVQSPRGTMIDVWMRDKDGFPEKPIYEHIFREYPQEQLQVYFDDVELVRR